MGLDGSYRKNTVHINGQEYFLLGAGEWRNDSTFTVCLRAIETIACQTLTFTFRKNRVMMRPACSPPMKDVVSVLSAGAASLIKNPLLLRMLYLLFQVLPKILEPGHRGKIMRERISP